MMRALLLTLLLGLPAQAKPNANELCNQADGLLARHEIKAGIDKYFQAIEQDKKCARAYAALGHVYYEASSGGAEPDRLSNFAIQLLDKAILLNPKDDKSLFYRGDLYVNQQQFAKALKDLNRSLAIRPGS
ncbi:MAG: tetratricopeptide repeat protein, partial [Candidatus Eremiobacteraeota bacterium]|nr:tetratricopeptide repeat protein [Candidatus Eremiobacteraeota bacterium]